MADAGILRRCTSFLCSVTRRCKAASAAPACSANPDVKVADFSVPVTELRTANGDPSLKALKQFGVKTIIRYYDHPDETIACKTLLKEESDAIISNDMSIAVVFQHNNDDPETFIDKTRGAADAKRALALAAANGQPFGSTIYFGVDGVDQVINDVVYEYAISGGKDMTEDRKAALLKKDKSNQKHINQYERFLAYGSDAFAGPVNKLGPESIVPYVKGYFSDINRVFREAASADPARTFDIGAYGSGLICRVLLADKSLNIKHCWLAQSTGWPEYDRFKTGNTWSLLQENRTICPDWQYPRDTKNAVEFDFNHVNATQPDFGQWSVKREAGAPIGRSTKCPAL